MLIHGAGFWLIDRWWLGYLAWMFWQWWKYGKCIACLLQRNKNWKNSYPPWWWRWEAGNHRRKRDKKINQPPSMLALIYFVCPSRFVFMIVRVCNRNFLSLKQLIYEKLPKDISERHVLLLDPVLATGNFLAFVECFQSSIYVMQFSLKKRWLAFDEFFFFLSSF